MYREISEERRQAIRDVYLSLEPMKDELRTDVARRVITAATCSESPFSVDRVLDDMCKQDKDYRSEGRHHRMPIEKIKRVF